MLKTTITLKEACKRSGLSRRGLMLNQKKGYFSAHKSNQTGHWEIDEPSFEQWLKDRSPSPTGTGTTVSNMEVPDTIDTELRITNKVLEAQVEALTQRAERAEALVDKLMQPFWKRWRS